MLTSPAKIRPLSLADTQAREKLRTMLAPFKGALNGVEARDAFAAIMQRTPPADGVEFRDDAVGGIAGIWCFPEHAEADRVVLYLHGGWFVWGSARTHQHFASHIAQRSGCAVFVADYRLAPEHPLPAAITDVRCAYDGLTARGYHQIAIAGDSAGGALAIELMASLVRDAHTVRPTCAVLLSPLTDLTLSNPTWETRDHADLYFTKSQARGLVSLYLAGSDAADPLASPINLELSGLPPIRVHTGDDEVLLDDSMRFVESAQTAGVDIQLDVWEGMLHVFPNALALFEASRLALDEIGAFIAQS